MIWNLIFVAYIITSMLWIQHFMVRQTRLEREARKWRRETLVVNEMMIDILLEQERLSSMITGEPSQTKSGTGHTAEE